MRFRKGKKGMYQVPLLRTKQEIAIAITVRFPVRGHGGVDRVHIQRDAFSDIRIAAAG